MVGKTVGSYRIEEELGRGSAATVYRAVDTFLGRTVALKILHRELVADGEFMKRFRREAIACAKLLHPNIMHIYDVAGKGQTQYIVMEYCDGTTLSEVLRKEHRLDTTAAGRILPQIGMAMDYIHGHGLVHRDIKPGNIMISRKGEVKITDMGIARAVDATGITVSGTILGTPEYMSPEQVRGEEVDNRSDIYSLGIVMFEMLSGEIPFKSKNALVLAHKHVNGKIPKLHFVNSSVSTSLGKVILKAMAKSPADRYKNCSELLKDWEKALNFKGTASEEKSHRRAVFAAAISLVLSFCIAGTASFIKLRKTSIGIESVPLKKITPFAADGGNNIAISLPQLKPGKYDRTPSVEVNRRIEKQQGRYFYGYGDCFTRSLDFRGISANEENYAFSNRCFIPLHRNFKRSSTSKKPPLILHHNPGQKVRDVTINSQPNESISNAKSYFGKIALVNRSAGIVVLHIGGAKSGAILRVVRKGHLITHLKIIRTYDFNTAVCKTVDNDGIWRLRAGDIAIGERTR